MFSGEVYSGLLAQEYHEGLTVTSHWVFITWLDAVKCFFLSREIIPRSVVRHRANHACVYVIFLFNRGLLLFKILFLHNCNPSGQDLSLFVANFTGSPAVASCSRFISPLPKTFLCQLTTKTPNTACCVNTRMYKFLGIMFVAFGLVPTNKEVKFKTFPLSALPHGGVKLQRSQKMPYSE